MSLFLATLLSGVFFLVLGLLFFLRSQGFAVAIKSFPRSSTAALICFGGGAIWFLYRVWNLSTSDFGEYHVILSFAFAVIAALAFKCIPDFLAVRGLAVLVLLTATPLLGAAYMEYQYPARLFMVSMVYVAIALALWLGAQPWRLRDFLDWLFARSGRARILGGLLAAYGLLLCAVAFAY